MLSTHQIAAIESDVERAATKHLNARDAQSALEDFAHEVIAVSNTSVFSSRESLAANVHEYYKILKTVTHASWEDIHIHVISESAATFTAGFRYGFISKDDITTNLRGVWAALYEIEDEAWKIRIRHETFEQL